MFSMLTLLYALNTYLTLINTNIYIYIYIYMMIKSLFIFFSSIIFLGWLFVTYRIDLVYRRYYILVSYRSLNYGIEPSLMHMPVN